MKIVVDTSAISPLLFLLGYEKVGHLKNKTISSIEYYIERWTYENEMDSHISYVKDAALVNPHITDVYSKIIGQNSTLKGFIDALIREGILSIKSAEDVPCTSSHLDCEYIKKDKLVKILSEEKIKKNKGELLSYLLAILIQANLLLIVDYSATGSILEEFKVTLKQQLDMGSGSLFPWMTGTGDFVVLLETCTFIREHKDDAIKIVELLIEYFDTVALTRSNASAYQKERLEKFKKQLLGIKKG